MAWCVNCGANDQHGRFCTQCGATVEQPPAAQGQSHPWTTEQTVLGQPLAVAPPPPGHRDQAVAAPETRSWGGGFGALAAAAVVVAVVVTTVLVVRAGSTDDAVDPSPVPVPVASSSVEASQESAASFSAAAKSAADPSATSLSATTTATTSSSPAPLDPMGGPNVNIDCGPSYIVQVASELDQAAFVARVAELRTLNQVPPGAKWAETHPSCSIFASSNSYFVLYAGPFTNPYDACAARLASPPDAFIEGTTPETASQYVTCMCPEQDIEMLPEIDHVGQQGVWVGELQRILRSEPLKYDVGQIDADPANGVASRWGIYTADTANAVGRFQAEHGLAVTQQANLNTWAALKAAQC